MEPLGDLRKGFNIKTSTPCQEKPDSCYSNLSTRNGQENMLLAMGVKQVLTIRQIDTKREILDLVLG